MRTAIGRHRIRMTAYDAVLKIAEIRKSRKVISYRRPAQLDGHFVFEEILLVIHFR